MVSRLFVFLLWCLVYVACSDEAVPTEQPAAAPSEASAKTPMNELVTSTNEAKLLSGDSVWQDQLGSSVALSEDALTAIVGAQGDGDNGTLAGAAYIFSTNGTGQKAKLRASDGATNDQFGFSVAISGNTAIVGSPGDDDSGSASGSAYVFVRDPNKGSWKQQAKLLASDGAAGDAFGNSVAISGDTAIVGAPQDNDKGTWSGSAYVFVRSGTTWTEQQKLTASDGATNDQLGRSVSLANDMALLGAPRPGGTSGSAYVFVRSGTTWTEEQKLTASDGTTGDTFAWSVSLANDMALVGALGPAGAGGSAYVFVRSGTTWTEQQKLTATGGAIDDLFAFTVSLAGTTAVVGAPYHDAKGKDSGSAYVFVRNPNTLIWSQQQKLTASDGDADDNFGIRVAVSGNVVLTGAWLDETATSLYSGSAYVYKRSGTTWSQTSKLLANDGAASDFFGTSVALSGDTAIVGANQDGDNGLYSGAAYVFVRSANGTWSKRTKLLASDGATQDNFGYSVALSGDTAIVGALGDSDKGSLSGSAYVFVRDANGNWTEQQKLTASDGADNDIFGWSVALSGTTAIVGAPSLKGTSSAGAAYVFERSGTTWTQQQKLTASDGMPDDRFGSLVTLSDNTAVVSAPQDSDKGTYSGSAYVFERSGTTWTQQQKLTASDGAENDIFGASGALLGHTLLVGARNHDDLGSGSGSVYVFVRSGATWIEQQELTASDGAPGDRFGSSIALTVDAALVGAPGDIDMGLLSGSAYMFVRSEATWTEQVKITPPDLFPGDQFGLAAALSQDGQFGIVGAPFADAEDLDTGSAYVYSLRRSLGSSCSSYAVCESGFCVDGVCCSSPCDGPCQACSAALRDSGNDGFCGPVKGGSDPDDDCPQEDVSSCGRTGQCSASGTCELYTYGNTCKASDCVEAGQRRWVCNGFGTCVADPSIQSCGLHICVDGACQGTCSADVDCAPQAHCDTAVGECKKDGPLGAPCVGANECASGLCVDGVCCDGPCGGTCQACSQAAGSVEEDGYCGRVQSGMKDDGCMADPDKPCSFTGVCSEFGACELASSGTLCGEPTCKLAIRYERQVCDGFGACVPDLEQPDSCFPYVCDSDDKSCKTSCTSKADCAGAYGCQGGICVPGCASIVDCEEGEVCDPITARCVRAEEGVTMSESCDCRIPGHGSSDSRWLTVGVGLALALLRRSRTRPSKRPTGLSTFIVATFVLVMTGCGELSGGAPPSATTHAGSAGPLASSVEMPVDLRETLLEARNQENAEPSSRKIQTSSLIAAKQEAKLLSGDLAAGDHFGHAVALSEDGLTAIVGAWWDDDKGSDAGAAYVFEFNGTSWTQAAKLRASDGSAYDDFGFSVAISGDTVAIGANLEDEKGTDAGSVYVFARNPISMQWIQQQKLSAADGAAGSYFGSSVALKGHTLVVGTPFDAENGEGSGAAYVYVRDPVTTVWSLEQKLLASDGGQQDSFGRSVALSGDTTLVGAYLDDEKGADSGSAYVFVRSGTTWTEQQKLTASDGAPGDCFAWSVAISSDMALIGALYDDDPIKPTTDSGSAYVFVRSGTTWSQQKKFTASNGATNDYFGYSVALSGNTAMVGAHNAAVLGNPYAGMIYTFDYDPSTLTWSQKANVIAGAAGDHFGYSVALSGNRVIVGAVGRDDMGVESGSAFLFVRPGTTWLFEAQLLASDSATEDFFARSIALSGNLAIVGAPGDDDNGVDSGAAYVFLRAPNGAWIKRTKLLASDGEAGDGFGMSVALSGDIAIVGAPNSEDNSAGSTYVFVRDANGIWIEQAKLVPANAAPGDKFGNAVALSGDTAIVGASGRDIGPDSDRGAAYVFVRSGTTWTQEAYLEATSGAANDSFANSVALSGNTALVGASHHDEKGANSGAAYVFVRSGTTWTEQQKLTASDGAASDLFGGAVALSDDTALVGAHGDSDNGLASGSAYLFVHSGTTWVEQPKLLASDGVFGDNFGYSVALSGDTALIGAPGDNDNGTDSGSAYVFVRSGTNWLEQMKLSASDGAEEDFFGGSVSLSQDGSLGLIGAPEDDDEGTNSGSAYAHSFRRSVGTTCLGAAVCESGFCVDGVCCNSPCNGPCQACSADRQSLGVDGFCGPAKEGTNPGDRCLDSRTLDPESCGTKAACSAGGTCQFYEYGTSCAKDVCLDASNVQRNICNGFGSCVISPIIENCSSYICQNGACLISCAGDADCAGDAHCDTTTNQCTSDRQLGQPCAGASECASGFCVDGVCCDGPCTGTCRACSMASRGTSEPDGYCAIVAKGTQDVACKADPAVPCGFTGVCGDSGACELTKSGTLCGESTCDGVIMYENRICNGANACEPDPASIVPCSPYVCDAEGKSCKTECIRDDDCVGQYQCRGRVCVPGCNDVSECHLGEACDPLTRRCVPVDDLAAEPESCDCQTPGRGSPSNRWPALSLALALLLLRRARSRRASALPQA